jgi:hypothetical protein
MVAYHTIPYHTENAEPVLNGGGQDSTGAIHAGRLDFSGNFFIIHTCHDHRVRMPYPI